MRALDGDGKVACSRLWNPDLLASNNAIFNAVAHVSEVFLRTRDDTLLITGDTTNILNQHHGRLKQFNKSNHPHVQFVSRIITSGVIVQIGVALAWRAADDDINPLEAILQFGFVWSFFAAKFSVNVLFNRLIEEMWRLEIGLERFFCCWKQIASHHDFEFEARRFRCFMETKCNSTAPGKNVARA